MNDFAFDPLIHKESSQSAQNSIELDPKGPSIFFKSRIQNLQRKMPVILIFPWEKNYVSGGGISWDFGYFVFQEFTKIEDIFDFLVV